ncbi:MAG: hypothetical protein K8M05_28510 [Deltaproteobacteria bacterium]|nr:hypothetical protein [Kofleriaceae bacterium]
MLLTLFLQLALGLGFAFAARDRIRADGPSAPPAFLLVLIHVGLVTAPVTLYFYAAHAAWSWLYIVDPERVPALAIVPLVVVHGLVLVGGWYGGAWLVRTDRKSALLYTILGAAVAFLIGFVVALGRLTTATSYAGYLAGASGGLMSVELGWALLVSFAASAAAATYVLIELLRDSRRVRAR